MSKRAPQFARKERDFYPTPEAAVLPLLRHVPQGSTFYEPCAGDGALVDHLVKHGLVCAGASDIEPMRSDVERLDAFDLSEVAADFIIVNTPWSRPLLHELIVHFQSLAPTWLLFDADWAHTKQAAPFLPQCSHIVSVGRLIWIPGTKMTGKDNCAWYRFDKNHSTGPKFIGQPFSNPSVPSQTDRASTSSPSVPAHNSEAA